MSESFQQQVGEWGKATFPQSTPQSIVAHLRREVEEHFHPTGDLSALRTELVHVAAVAVQIVEHIDELAALRAQITEATR